MSWPGCSLRPRRFLLGRSDGLRRRSWRIVWLFEWVAAVSKRSMLISPDLQGLAVRRRRSKSPRTVLCPPEAVWRSFAWVGYRRGDFRVLVVDHATVSSLFRCSIILTLRRYRIFAELLELATQSGLRIPALAPPTFPTAAAAAAPPPPDYYATPISSGNPIQVLQQPAFYFYTAACCSVQRQKRFEEALSLEVDLLHSVVRR